MPSVPNSGPAVPPPPPAWNAQPAAGMVGPPAGFWIRFVALLIDGLIVGAAIVVLVGILSVLVGINIGTQKLTERDTMLAVLLVLVLAAVMILGAWLYEAILTSSPRGATWGKQAMGLRVLRSDGTRLSFGRATARYFCKNLITPLLPLAIGYLMAAFTRRKQALHDFMADTVVVKAS